MPNPSNLPSTLPPEIDGFNALWEGKKATFEEHIDLLYQTVPTERERQILKIVADTYKSLDESAQKVVAGYVTLRLLYRTVTDERDELLDGAIVASEAETQRAYDKGYAIGFMDGQTSVEGTYDSQFSKMSSTLNRRDKAIKDLKDENAGLRHQLDVERQKNTDFAGVA